MANFATTQFSFGSRIANKRALERDIAARQAEESSKAFRASRKSLIDESLTTFDSITTAAAEAAKTGNATEAHLDTFRNSANGALLATITTLQNDVALAIQSGADPNDPRIQELQQMQQSLASHAAVFDARIDSAILQKVDVKTPEEEGAAAARERAEEVRVLSQELGLDEGAVAEGLGIVPGQPAPTELEKLERSLRLMDSNNVAQDDPARLRVLNRLSSVTTPSVSDVIAPLIQKLASGEELTDAEQRALDAAQKLSMTEQLMRGLMGGAAGSSTPTMRVDDNGNLVPVAR